MVTWLVLLSLALAQQPHKTEVEPWLGVYRSDAEEIELSWKDGLLLRLDHIEIPVDGAWHETVSVYSVRHRARWDAGEGAIFLSEQHNQGAHWRFKLERGERGELVKWILSETGETSVVRRYEQKPTE